jgi:arginase
MASSLNQIDRIDAEERIQPMLKIHVIAPGVREASTSADGRGLGLNNAAGVLEAGGFFDSIPSLGVEIEGITHPEPVAMDISDDPTVRLGAFNAQIANAASRAIARGAQPFLVGGTCSHLPGMVGGLEQAYGATARIGLIWMDAHGDFNTPRTSYSQMLGGMPVAVVAGLCYPSWREQAGISSPMPTDRILMIDVRNLDDREEALIRSTDVTIARFGKNGETDEIVAAIDALAKKVDYLYLHIDSDILDIAFQPNHPTAEPNGPDDKTIDALIERVMGTGKVVALAVVSINPEEPGGAISLASGQQMMRTGLRSWASAGANV